MSAYWVFVLCSIMMTTAPDDSAEIISQSKTTALADCPAEADEQDGRLTKLMAVLGLAIE